MEKGIAKNITKVYKSLSAFLFYLTLVVIVSGINFSDGRSPGWFIQPLPVNDEYGDLFFIDSLRGWMVSTGYPGTSDTGYIIHTTNGGYNWVVQKAEPQLFWRVQFLDTNYGYVVGGSNVANIQKTTDGGLNWIDISASFYGIGLQDLCFVNKDTGWIVLNGDPFNGGIYKTENGGGNWIQQKFDPNAYEICFINKDTGWYINNVNGTIWRTKNGGLNWKSINTGINSTILHIYFINGTKGWIQSGSTGNSIKYTTNGGYNWDTSSGNFTAGYDFGFINENTGYSGTFNYKIAKSTDGGLSWGYQIFPISYVDILSVLKNDTSNAWGGKLAHTFDGGGPLIFTGIDPISTSVAGNFKLYQNYPNPFNPVSSIKYQVLRSAEIKIIVFSIAGKEIKTLVNKKQTSGTYQVTFDGGNLPSGIYFYSLFADGVRIDTKKAILLK